MEDECLCPPCWVYRQRLLHLLAWNQLLARASEGGAHPPGPPFPQGKLEHFLGPLFTLHWGKTLRWILWEDPNTLCLILRAI